MTRYEKITKFDVHSAIIIGQLKLPHKFHSNEPGNDWDEMNINLDN